MGERKLANIPDNWLYDTSRFSRKDTEEIFNTMKVEKENLTPCEVLVKPLPGHERATRYIVGSVFKRVRGSKARELLAKHKAAKQ